MVALLTDTQAAATINKDSRSSHVINLWLLCGGYLLMIPGEEAFNYAVPSKIVK